MPLLPSTHLPTCPPACHPPQVKADLLLDQAAVEAALRQAGASATGVTHIFHCAYIMRQEAAEECGVNLSMLRNGGGGGRGGGLPPAARVLHAGNQVVRPGKPLVVAGVLLRLAGCWWQNVRGVGVPDS